MCDILKVSVVQLAAVYPRLGIKWGYLVFMSQSREWGHAATMHLILLPVDSGGAKSAHLHFLEVQENKIKTIFRIPK